MEIEFRMFVINYFEIMLLIAINQLHSCVVGHETYCLNWRAKDLLKDSCYSSANGRIFVTDTIKIAGCVRTCMTFSNPPCMAANYEKRTSKCELFGEFEKQNVTFPCYGSKLILLHGERSGGGRHRMIAPSSAGCYPGWAAYQNKCYKLMKTHKNFMDADIYCRKYGASLASIHSHSENKFLSGLLYQINGYAFIGLIKQSAARINPMMIWTDNTAYNFNHWKTGEPNGQPYINSACTVISTRCGNRWSDANCYEPLPFVCEKDGQ